MVIGFVFPRAFLLSFLQLNSSASNGGGDDDNCGDDRGSGSRAVMAKEAVL